jgi:hypothetical protein
MQIGSAPKLIISLPSSFLAGSIQQRPIKHKFLQTIISGAVVFCLTFHHRFLLLWDFTFEKKNNNNNFFMAIQIV